MIYLILSLLIAIVLEAIPLPAEVDVLRPAFLLMIVFFWATTVQGRRVILLAWLAAIIYDAVSAHPLATHSFSVLFILGVGLVFYPRFLLLPIIQQTFIVGFILLIAQAINFFVLALSQGQDAQDVPVYLLSVITSMVIWPVLVHFMRSVRERSELK